MRSSLSTKEREKTEIGDKGDLVFFFKDMKNRSNINNRKNGRKSRTLSYTYISFKKW